MNKPCLHQCTTCPFYGPQVGSKGDPLSPLVVIGESPGKNELKEREPFVGASGKIIELALRNSPVEPYYINAMQCFPGNRDDKDESKMVAATQACRHHVLEELGKAPRKVILALGAWALRSITDNYDLKITQERGRVFPTEFDALMVPSVHPAFLMTGGKGGTPQQFFRDCQYAIDILEGKPLKSPPDVKYHVAICPEEIWTWAHDIPPNSIVAGDIETSDLQALKGRILCAGFAHKADEVIVIPEHLTTYAQLILRRKDVRFLWHNGQFDIKWLWHNGMPEARVDEDTILLSYSLDENGGIHGLEQVSSDWLNSPNWKGVLDSFLPKKNSSYELVPRDILHKYMAYDIGNTRANFDILRPRVALDPHLEKLYTRTLIPATNFLAKVESNGIYVDVDKVRENQQSYDVEVEKAAAAIVAIGKDFPDSHYTEKLPGSWKQIQKLLYDDLKIKPYKNKRSTDQKVLDQLPAHPAITALRRHRKVAKERGTYVTSLANFRDPKTGEYNLFIPRHIMPDGRVHSSLALFKTRTGRLASSDPNVQNVPRNPQIRGQYIAGPGRRLVECDLNQAELRVLATISGDPELCRIYLTAGMSLHDEVRASIWGYPKDWSDALLAAYLDKFRLTPATRYDENGKDLLLAEQKMRAKNVNFGTVYGITAAGLAEQCDCSVQDAQEMLNAWFKKFQRAADYITACKNAPLHGRTLITAFGRKKRPGIVSAELAQGIQNEFANFPEQSPASDITLHSGIELEPILCEQYDTKVINLIHDALLLECPDDDNIAKEVATLTCNTMSRVPKDWGFKKIPFLAEAKQGYRWGSLKDLKVAA